MSWSMEGGCLILAHTSHISPGTSLPIKQDSLLSGNPMVIRKTDTQWAPGVSVEGSMICRFQSTRSVCQGS